MSDAATTPSAPEQGNAIASAPAGQSRLTHFLLVFAGVLVGVLVSVILGGLLATVISDLGTRIYEVVQNNPVVFGLVALLAIIGAIVGGWVALRAQDEDEEDTPAAIASRSAGIPGSAGAAAPAQGPLRFQALRDVVGAFTRAVKALFLLVANTVTTLLPSTAFTARIDETYSGEMLKTYQAAIGNLKDLNPEYKDIILKNWLGQITWADNRATRERNVNEIIRWWQILLGVLIPALTTANQTVVVGLMGIFVAFLTSIAQFRRPDENWRHYRILSENYQNEIWDFITLSGEQYLKKNPADPAAPAVRMSYDEAFIVFHQRMTRLRKEDVATYFKDMSTGSRPRNLEELRKELAEIQQILAATGQAAPGTAVLTRGQVAAVEADESTDGAAVTTAKTPASSTAAG